ncbi:MAG TPA: PAS domain S-box protein, partial [Thermoanaerobaculia bacterium]|nr:PAS domain S-box protein [Thermoanaerobaculia bacterium]
ELYRQIVEATQEAVIFAASDGRIQLWNGGAERIFGWSQAEAVGQSLDLIIPEKLRGRHWEGWSHVMETGVTRYGTDLLAVPGVRKDGARISLEFTVALIRDGAGAIAGVAAVLRDVTERWQRDRELRARLAELEERNPKE